MVRYPIGDVFIIAGQSNASGHATNNQTNSQGKRALLLGNDYAIKQGDDPTDDSTGQMDAVSIDTVAEGRGGSYWPLVSNLIIANTGHSVTMVPCAKGGTSIAVWQPSANHYDRATLYGSMLYRMKCMGFANIKAVLWHQGETDVGNSMNEATYNTNLDALANALFVDSGIKLMPCKIHNMGSGYTDAQKNAIWNAITTAWGDNANVLAGPDLSDLFGLDPLDKTHIKDDATLATVADRWWSAILAAIYT